MSVINFIMPSTALTRPIGGIAARKHKNDSRSSSHQIVLLDHSQVSSIAHSELYLAQWCNICRLVGLCHWPYGRYAQHERLEMDLYTWCVSRGVVQAPCSFSRPEGTLTCVVACILFFFISDFPEEAKWLNDDEKAFVKARLQDDVGQSGREESTKSTDILRPFRDCAVFVLQVLGLRN